jgi:hypothetical protein
VKRDEVAQNLRSGRLLGLGALVSLLVSVLVLVIMRPWSRGAAMAGEHTENDPPLGSVGAGNGQVRAGGPQRVPDPQPAVDTSMPTKVPDHFTEDVILPGFTETGQDVERDDETEGRSPEGV